MLTKLVMFLRLGACWMAAVMCFAVLQITLEKALPRQCNKAIVNQAKPVGACWMSAVMFFAVLQITLEQGHC